MMTLDRKYWLYDLILLVILAGGLRLSNLDSIAFTPSEMGEIYLAKSILANKTPTYPSGLSDWDSILPNFLTALSFQIFGVSEWSARIPAALLGILTTIWIYLWGSHWLEPWVGRTSALLYTLWPWSVTVARSGTTESLQQFLYLLLITSAWKILECNPLGHPVVNPPSVAGKRPPLLQLIRRFTPVTVLILLSLLTDLHTILALSFLPFYLVIRAFWAWQRGGSADCEFSRCFQYFGYYLGVLISVLIIGSFFYPLTALSSAQSLEKYQNILFQIQKFGWIYAMGIILGSILAIRLNRPGWYVLSAAWGPLLAHELATPQSPPRTIYYLFPIFLALFSLPVGWGLNYTRTWINRTVKGIRNPIWKFALALAILLLAVGMLAQNTLFSERATVHILNGSPYLTDTTAINWREMALQVRQLDPLIPVVSTDPLPTLYYLGRVDFVYPYLWSPPVRQHPLSGTPILTGVRDLERLASLTGKVLILGSLDSFEKTFSFPEGKAIWQRLQAESSEKWEGPTEAMFLFEPGFSNPADTQSPRVPHPVFEPFR